MTPNFTHLILTCLSIRVGVGDKAQGTDILELVLVFVNSIGFLS